MRLAGSFVKELLSREFCLLNLARRMFVCGLPYEMIIFGVFTTTETEKMPVFLRVLSGISGQDNYAHGKWCSKISFVQQCEGCGSLPQQLARAKPRKQMVMDLTIFRRLWRPMVNSQAGRGRHRQPTWLRFILTTNSCHSIAIILSTASSTPLIL